MMLMLMLMRRPFQDIQNDGDGNNKMTKKNLGASFSELDEARASKHGLASCTSQVFSMSLSIYQYCNRNTCKRAVREIVYIAYIT